LCHLEGSRHHRAVYGTPRLRPAIIIAPHDRSVRPRRDPEEFGRTAFRVPPQALARPAPVSERPGNHAPGCQRSRMAWRQDPRRGRRSKLEPAAARRVARLSTPTRAKPGSAAERKPPAANRLSIIVVGSRDRRPSGQRAFLRPIQSGLVSISIGRLPASAASASWRKRETGSDPRWAEVRSSKAPPARDCRESAWLTVAPPIIQSNILKRLDIIFHYAWRSPNWSPLLASNRVRSGQIVEHNPDAA
jgi:hypothetical protein